MKKMCFVIALCFCATLLGFRLNWWCIPSAGYINSSDDGASAGQTAIGEVSGVEPFGDGTYGFWHGAMTPQICFDISDLVWNLDTVDILETRSMETGEGFSLTNCGNCNIGFGIRVLESSPISWVPGYYPDINRFVIRARFTNTMDAPLTYNTMRDYIRDAVSWSTDDVFGPKGNNFGLSDTEYLWFQFLSPVFSDEWIPNTITVELSARANLY